MRGVQTRLHKTACLAERVKENEQTNISRTVLCFNRDVSGVFRT